MVWSVLHIVQLTAPLKIWFVLEVKTGMSVKCLDSVIQEKVQWAKMAMNVLHLAL